MILYTPMPIESIWAVEGTETPSYREVQYCGIIFLVQPSVAGMGKIVQIKSCDPGVYLRPEFQPGREIPLFTPP